MKRIAVIPARGGSKRIPQKNIRPFLGRSIISYSIEAAKESGVFDKVVVSTDDEEIADISKEAGAEVPFLRPAALSDDHAGVFVVLQHAYKHYKDLGEEYDQVWLISACAPMLLPSDLQKAAELMNASDKDAVLAVGHYQAPVEWAFRMDEHSKLEPITPGAFEIRSQDLVSSVYDSGMFSGFSAARIRGETTASGDKGFHGFEIPRNRCVDIDELADWEFAESLYKAVFRSK